MEEKEIIYICGTRNNKYLEKAKIVLKTMIDGMDPDKTIIIHPDHSKLDKSVSKMAQERGIEVQTYPAPGKYGFEHNRILIDKATKVIAVPHETSYTVFNTVKMCKEKKIPASVYQLPPL